MAANHYYDFLSNVFNLMSSEDRQRMAELWKGYEQVFASVYQKFIENELNTSIADLQSFTTERWLPYDFPDSSKILVPAIFTSNQDLSIGINLTDRWLIKLQIDDGPIYEIDIRGMNASVTTIDEIKARINNTVGFSLARGIFENTVLQLVTHTVGPNSKITILEPSNPLRDASEFVFGVLPEQYPLSVPEYPHVYSNPYAADRVVGIPTLQEDVRDDTAVILVHGTDFLLNTDNGTIAFKNQPSSSKALWARKTLVDEETPWNNYGFLLDIYQKNTPSYRNVLQGLWFAFWNGPKPASVQSSLYLLFGLPVADEDGVISSVSAQSIQMIGRSGNLYEHPIPSELFSIVTVGQEVTRFDPLVNGIEVFDKINAPGFIEREIGRANIQRFLLDEASRGPGADTDETKALAMLEEHTFLPQISVEAFISPDINLGNVKTFLTSIKPLNKAFLFQVIVGVFEDEIEFIENLGLGVFIDVTPNLDSNQTTFAEQSILDDYEINENDAMNLDSDVIGASELLEIEVYDTNGLVDSFTA